ncbi:hypothetical protein BHE74_00015931 [Ensete ventricosum]|nr:hypothetical protein BHE74_00015931 [Ensete ventricosum]
MSCLNFSVDRQASAPPFLGEAKTPEDHETWACCHASAPLLEDDDGVFRKSGDVGKAQRNQVSGDAVAVGPPRLGQLELWCLEVVRRNASARSYTAMIDRLSRSIRVTEDLCLSDSSPSGYRGDMSCSAQNDAPLPVVRLFEEDPYGSLFVSKVLILTGLWGEPMQRDLQEMRRHRRKRGQNDGLRFETPHDREKSAERRPGMEGEKGKKVEVVEEKRSRRFRKICVFCGNQPGQKAIYQEAAIELGRQAAGW